MSRLEYFIHESPYEPAEPALYLRPTCPKLDPYFREIFETGQPQNGEIQDIEGNLLAKLFSTTVFGLDQWINGEPPSLPNYLVLVRNPDIDTRAFSHPDTSGMVLYNSYVFAAVPRGDHFNIVRPIRGSNLYGRQYNYNVKLGKMYQNVLDGLPKEYKAPVWRGK